MGLIKKFLFDKLFLLFVLSYFFCYIFLNNVNSVLFKFLSSLLLGGLIGYVTNMLAIWMLFNPKREILGVQGVIPKRKRDIACGFSNVIQQQLVNHRSIANFLNQNKDVFIKIADKICEYLRDGDVTFENLIGDKYTEFKDFLVRKVDIPNLIIRLTERYLDYLNDEDLEVKLREIFGRLHVDEMLWVRIKDKSLESLFPNLKTIILKAVEKGLSDKENVGKIKQVIGEFVAENLKIPIPLIGNIMNSVGQIIVDGAVDSFANNFVEHRSVYVKFEETLDEYLKNKISAVISQDELRSFLFAMIDSVPSRDFLKKLLDIAKRGIVEWTENIVDEVSRVKISKVFEYYETNLRDFLVNFFENYSAEFIYYIEKFLSQISFADIVREKIENFSVAELEEMTLKLAKKELRYVEIFGIPLGMIIGLIQFFVI
ncbi:MAG: DUF445 domain-containing protein [Fervidobacterium sp.]|nr:DUF445 domain-containing protein [Fervidobacterium sp.]